MAKTVKLETINHKMKVVNIHSREIAQDAEKIAPLFTTLSSKNDMIWPSEKWPRMKLDKGMTIGSAGGHGPVGYFVTDVEKGRLIRSQFTKPANFHGYHQFELIPQGQGHSLLQHTIVMNTSGLGFLSWSLTVRWLHDALVEDAMDKVENHFSTETKKSKWNLWVRILRSLLK